MARIEFLPQDGDLLRLRVVALEAALDLMRQRGEGDLQVQRVVEDADAFFAFLTEAEET